MIEIELAPLANQSLTVQIGDVVYIIDIREIVSSVMVAEVSRDNVTLISGVRLAAGTPVIPYRYKEAGNFLIITENDACPHWSEFGITQFLVYLDDAELEAYRAT